jgi:hypothetical protein
MYTEKDGRVVIDENIHVSSDQSTREPGGGITQGKHTRGIPLGEGG